MEWKNVVVLHLPFALEGRTITEVELPAQPVPVLREFDAAHPIGTALLRLDGDVVYADLTVRVSVPGLYPALGGILHRLGGFEVLSVGVSESPNVDAAIRPLEAA